MTRRPAGALTLVRSRAGRLELKRRLGNHLWPVVARFARGYRLTLGRRPRVVAVVGSVGKTTTLRAVSAVLGLPVRRQALLNMNSHAAVGRALLGVRPWQRRAALEVAINGPGQMAIQAATVRPDVVVVTAIARDHWRSFGTLEQTRAEKAEIVRRLAPTGVAVLNADDPNVRWMATQTRARVVLVGEADDAEVRVTEIEFDWPHGMRCVVHVGGQARPVRLRLVGRHMIFPALAAIAVAHLEGVPLDSAVAAVERVEPTPGRMQTMALANGAFVLRDDFKGSLDPMEAALAALAEIPARRRIVVAGEIAEESGNEDYRLIGRKVGAIADRAIFVGRGKTYLLYRTGATAAGLARERIEHARNAHEVIAMLRDELEPGDVVLTSGRWQRALGRVGLALAGRDVQCRADPCPFKRMLCDVCPMLERPFDGLPGAAVELEP